MRLVVSGDADVDQAELDSLTSQLRQRLLEMDVDDVRLGRSGHPAPEGAKPGELIAVGALAVSLATAVLRPTLRLIEIWMQNRPVRTVTVDIDGRVLELGHASKEQQQQMLDLYVEAVRSTAETRSGESRVESPAGRRAPVGPVAPDAAQE
ncbi:hypothetical protein QQY66_17115 [Streptomyces sp. DG2A-72]|uniref:hypothetical protein n=1 Tax=Streptomyces sp. DG2A-72 TaxID=3051386 RepID=UPI00265BED77|nr:hypothetical protein [Streptomyces sp. DG2A-72]MDO0933326.1 hypothetical protein [Streptomyces sp. DG2A-72]